MNIDKSSQQYKQVQGAAILLCAMHHFGKIGDKSLQITVSGSAFGAVKMPEYIIEVYPAQKQNKGSCRKQSTNKPRAKRHKAAASHVESEPCCVRCGHSKPCIFVRRGPSCRKWWADHLSPVALKEGGDYEAAARVICE